METATIKKSLFERLGGRSGISTIVDLTVDNHMKNPAIQARFLPYLQTPERLATLKSTLLIFLVRAVADQPNIPAGIWLPPIQE